MTNDCRAEIRPQLVLANGRGGEPILFKANFGPSVPKKIPDLTTTTCKRRLLREPNSRVIRRKRETQRGEVNRLRGEFGSHAVGHFRVRARQVTPSAFHGSAPRQRPQRAAVFFFSGSRWATSGARPCPLQRVGFRSSSRPQFCCPSSHFGGRQPSSVAALLFSDSQIRGGAVRGCDGDRPVVCDGGAPMAG